jgi:hypothetical protein
MGTGLRLPNQTPGGTPPRPTRRNPPRVPTCRLTRPDDLSAPTVLLALLVEGEQAGERDVHVLVRRPGSYRDDGAVRLAVPAGRCCPTCAVARSPLESPESSMASTPPGCGAARAWVSSRSGRRELTCSWSQRDCEGKSCSRCRRLPGSRHRLGPGQAGKRLVAVPRQSVFGPPTGLTPPGGWHQSASDPDTFHRHAGRPQGTGPMSDWGSDDVTINVFQQHGKQIAANLRDQKRRLLRPFVVEGGATRPVRRTAVQSTDHRRGGTHGPRAPPAASPARPQATSPDAPNRRQALSLGHPPDTAAAVFRQFWPVGWSDQLSLSMGRFSCTGHHEQQRDVGSPGWRRPPA